jgi:hypothetical protein
MPFGTATHQLRKLIMFSLAQKCGMNVCYRCETKILAVKEMSIDHKVSWEKSDDPRRLFFEVENIAFSHLSCNVAAASKPFKRFSSNAEKDRANSRIQRTDPIKKAKRNLARRNLRAARKLLAPATGPPTETT